VAYLRVMVIACKRSLLLALVVLSLAAPATAAASEPNGGESTGRATATSRVAGFRDDRGDVLTFILDAVGITLAGTAATFGMTRLLPTGSRPRIALP
jgi:hypothetical protein